ncbi:hypothetical protein SDC9_90575 [bioreactor metagenome]|uniref:Uncharacterized protein n=1 Tax=bioreactor metagenome TaxID=1076179 RepID=A0A644ZU15_9ZZZZ
MRDAICDDEDALAFQEGNHFVGSRSGIQKDNVLIAHQLSCFFSDPLFILNVFGRFIFHPVLSGNTIVSLCSAMDTNQETGLFKSA